MSRGIPGAGVWLVAIPVPVAGGGAVEDADHAFDNVVDAGEVTTVLAVVDDLYRLASEDGLGEFEQRLNSPGSIACVTRPFFTSRKDVGPLPEHWARRILSPPPTCRESSQEPGRSPGLDALPPIGRQAALASDPGTGAPEGQTRVVVQAARTRIFVPRSRERVGA